MKKSHLLISGILFAALLPFGNAARLHAAEGVSIKPYGFVRFDASLDDTRLPAGDWDLYVKPEGDPAHDQRQLTMTARHTRIGINLVDERGELPVKLTAKIEVDFAGGFASSSTAARQPLLRLRHAWVQAEQGRNALCIGQDWALISGPFPATTSFVVGAGKGNLWMRVPQVRYTRSYDNFRFSVSANRAMAAESKHLDETAGSFDPVSEGELTGHPWWMGRAWLDQGAFSFSVSGHYGSEELATGTTVNTWSANADMVWKQGPLAVTLRGFTGANLNTFFGGVFQGVSGMEEVESKGGWGQLAWTSTGPWGLAIGGGMDDPDDDLLGASARAKNSWTYAVISRKTGALTHKLGIDLLTTAYTDDAAGLAVGDGSNTRVSWQTLWTF